MDETKATYTPNIRLEKPGRKQRYDVGVFNANYDKIDKAIGDNKLLANGKENIGVAKKLADNLEASKENKGVAKSLDDALKTEILNSVLSVKDFPNSVGGVNGFQKLPNGFIIQWFIGASMSYQGEWNNQRFPIAFPNKCLMIANSDRANQPNPGTEFVTQITNITNTYVNVYCQRIGDQLGAIRPLFIAIGY